jgi:hypothetical protein
MIGQKMEKNKYLKKLTRLKEFNWPEGFESDEFSELMLSNMTTCTTADDLKKADVYLQLFIGHTAIRLMFGGLYDLNSAIREVTRKIIASAEGVMRT